MRKRVMLMLALGCLTIALPACTIGNPQTTLTPPVFQLMPDLPGYHVVEGQALQTYIVGLAEGAALLVGQPELAVLVSKVDRVIACYQSAGAFNARVFSDEASPLSSGAIAIADRNRLSDPNTLFRCVGGGVVPFSAEPTLNPCSFSYTLERDGNAFYIVYVGTTAEICSVFCANLQGCTAH